MTPDLMIARLNAGKPVPGRHVVVVAHPDDEVISFGGALCCLEDVVIVQLTEDTPEREAERAAAQVAGGWSIPVIFGGSRFRHAHDDAAMLLRLVDSATVGADVVWTHPYEGGHLDHDTAAWLVQTVCGSDGTRRMEFASYHMGVAKAQVFGNFWPPVDAPPMDDGRFHRKLAAIAAYRSQAHILRKFLHPAREPYRVAPVYDFTQAPPVPRSRWDAKGYLPTTAAWRDAIAAVGQVAA